MPSFIGFVPTPDYCIGAFFDLAPVTSYDVVYDLGCGDGRILFAALERGAGRVVGIDLNADLIATAQETARNRKLEERASFINADFMEVNLSEATLVLCYVNTAASEALKPKFERELKPGTRVVVEVFSISGWKPVKTLERGGKTFYLYVMPPQNGRR
jgi:ubiquinone/menaquinone biosynthesis C-methylase UbiE